MLFYIFAMIVLAFMLVHIIVDVWSDIEHDFIINKLIDRMDDLEKEIHKLKNNGPNDVNDGK